MAGKIAVQLKCSINGKQTTFIIDTVSSYEVTTTSTITTHPIVSGDEVADHMYRNPIQISMSGTFSLNAGTKFTYGSGSSKFSSIESLFEQIKNEGILCELVKMSTSDSDNKVQFSKRSSMALTSITWTEKENSLGFRFSFNQAMLVKVSSTPVQSSKSDTEYLPTFSDAIYGSFSDELLDYDAVS